VVLLRALEQRGLLSSEPGRVAIGWLIVEDVFTVVALVVLPTLAPGGTGGGPSMLPETSGSRSRRPPP
jgi:CPA2 family monovalent cation:H+ antiporter-2